MFIFLDFEQHGLLFFLFLPRLVSFAFFCLNDALLMRALVFDLVCLLSQRICLLDLVSLVVAWFFFTSLILLFGLLDFFQSFTLFKYLLINRIRLSDMMMVFLFFASVFFSRDSKWISLPNRFPFRIDFLAIDYWFFIGLYFNCFALTLARQSFQSNYLR